MYDKPKHPGGRPEKYDPAMCDVVIELMTEGADLDEVVVALDCCKQTFYTYKRTYPEFLDAVQKGTRLSKAWWKKQGRINLCSERFNTKLYQLIMQNKKFWDPVTYKDVRMTKDVTIDKVSKLTSELAVKLNDF